MRKITGKQIFRKLLYSKVLSLALNGLLANSLIFPASLGYAFETLSPRVEVSRAEVLAEFSSATRFRELIEGVRSFKHLGACRTLSLNLLFIIMIRERTPVWIVVDESHVWVETEKFILDVSMESNRNFLMQKRHDPELFRAWEETQGVILQESKIAKKFYSGLRIKLDDSELRELRKTGFPLKVINEPGSLTLKINNAAAQAEILNYQKNVSRKETPDREVFLFDLSLSEKKLIAGQSLGTYRYDIISESAI